jgi:hypothetical protein
MDAKKMFTEQVRLTIENAEIRQAEIMQEFTSNFEHALEWRAEDMIKQQVRLAFYRKAQRRLDEDGFEGIIPWLEEQLVDRQARALSHPYEHNSTSLMSNAIQQWQCQAECALVAPDTGEITRMLGWLKRMQK